MQSEEKNQLQAENKRLKDHISKLEYKYNKLKAEYVSLMKKSIGYEIELQKCKKKMKNGWVELEQEEEEILPQLDRVDSLSFNQSIMKQSIVQQELRKSIARRPTIDSERLLEMFFILVPFGDVKNEIKFQWPVNITGNLSAVASRVEKFTFPHGVQVNMIEDDDEQSRKNEVTYGSLGQELTFILENDVGDSRVPILKKVNPRGKLFAYVFIKPQILVNDQKSLLQGVLAFCFISKFPFRDFFFDVNRSMQQTIKLRYISHQVDQVRNYDEMFEPLLKELYQTNISDFPLKQSWKTENSEIVLHIESQLSVLQSEKDFANNFAKRIPHLTLSQMIHYILVESHILFHSNQRKLLNDVFEFIRIVLRPLVWPFPVIYNLTQDLILVLQSPVPILIGAMKNKEELSKTQWDMSQVVIFDLDEMKMSQNYAQLHGLDKDILKFSKSLSEDSPLPVIQSLIRGKLAFATTGTTLNELSQFDLQFMETQMVEQYRLLPP